MATAREQVFVAQPLATAGQRVISSPFQFATTEDDNLQVVSANSLAGVVLAIQGRRVTSAGTIEPFAFVHTPNSDRSSKSENYKLGGGALLNLVVFAVSGAPRIGQTYVSVRIIRGLASVTVVLGALLGGYVTAVQPLAFPGSPIIDSIDGGGYPRVITGTQPAAGSDVSETVPTGARWLLRTFRSKLINGNVAGTRQPSLVISSGGSLVALVANPGTSAINQTADYYWLATLGFAPSVVGSVNVAGISPEVPLLAGAAFGTSTAGLNVLDAWLAPSYTVQEWLEVQS